MKYATGEMEVLKLKKSIENSDKLIKQLNHDVEMAIKKHKMLSSERERLSLMIDTKVCISYTMNECHEFLYLFCHL
jgi:hypothetical protein